MNTEFKGFRYRNDHDEAAIQEALMLFQYFLDELSESQNTPLSTVYQTYAVLKYRTIFVPLADNKRCVVLSINKYSDVLWEDGLVYPALRIKNTRIDGGLMPDMVEAMRDAELEQYHVHGNLELTFASPETDGIMEWLAKNLETVTTPTDLLNSKFKREESKEIGYAWTVRGHAAYQELQKVPPHLLSPADSFENYLTYDKRLQKIPRELHAEVNTVLSSIAKEVEKFTALLNTSDFTSGCFYNSMTSLPDAVSTTKNYLSERFYQEYGEEGSYNNINSHMWIGDFDVDGYPINETTEHKYPKYPE